MDITPKQLMRRLEKAKQRRVHWEAHWRECFDYTLPQRENALVGSLPGEKKTDKLFDATAPDAVEQLAASLLAQLTPPWGRWFGFTPGAALEPEEREMITPALDRAAEVAQSHFDRSNFAMEMHQCYLDLVTCGTASLLFEEAAPGESSAFRFTAIPIGEVVLEEGPSGRLDTTYRATGMTLAVLEDRFDGVTLPDDVIKTADDDPDHRFSVIEAVVPAKQGYTYMAFLEEHAESDDPVVLRQGTFDHSPFINFRWMKAPGEIYGRSPVMKTLPDIKTANKVVELTLKNAAIAVTGIWQAEDDGVLNPATVKLTPGTIIPKATGSQGLTPLEAPGKFDISQIVLNDLRANIRGALMVDRLVQVDKPTMTATEFLERSVQIARELGATYGRLQSELLTPLVMRALKILRRRGEIKPIRADGRTVDLQYRSPLALEHNSREADTIVKWIKAVQSLGGDAGAVIDTAAATRWLAKATGVPGELIRSETNMAKPGVTPAGPATPAPALPDLAEGALAGSLKGLDPKLVQTMTGIAEKLDPTELANVTSLLRTMVPGIPGADLPPVQPKEMPNG